MLPLIENGLRGGAIKVGAAGRIHNSTSLQCSLGRLVRGAGSPDIVEEWIVTRTSEDPKMIVQT